VMPAAHHTSMGTSRRNCPRAVTREKSHAARGLTSRKSCHLGHCQFLCLQS
jgi:hypothetical protein